MKYPLKENSETIQVLDHLQQMNLQYTTILCAVKGPISAKNKIFRPPARDFNSP